MQPVSLSRADPGWSYAETQSWYDNEDSTQKLAVPFVAVTPTQKA